MFKLPELAYGYEELEPFIDAQTMKIHHTKHHQTYLDKTNELIARHPELAGKLIEELMKDFDSLEMNDADKTILRNHGGGYINHTFFWEMMGPVKAVDNNLIEEISKEFGSVNDFKKLFGDTAAKHFGSGWAWLVKNEAGKLQVYSTPNQDSPLMKGHEPIICLDVWEHAYYLSYQNRRADYIENWWNVLKLI